jgi:hypothetical protein
MTGRARRILPPALEKPAPRPVRFPWLVPTIVVFAIVVVVAGVVYASVNGLLFSSVILQTPTPTPSAS